MHTLENYALTCGVKISEPYIYEKFFPLPVENYITFAPFENQEKNYPYWQEVIDKISEKTQGNTRIVQIGSLNDARFNNCIHLNGLLNKNQIAYIIKNSKLHFGVNDFVSQVASFYKKKIVSITDNYSEISRPFFSKEEDVINIESYKLLPDFKPYSVSKKEINTVKLIKPEAIYNSVLKLLGFEQENIKTLFSGEKYSNSIIYSHIPSSVYPFPQEKVMEIRMDIEHNEQILFEQLKTNKCSIVTSKPIQENILKLFKNNIFCIFYRIDNVDDSSFAELVQSYGIDIHFICNKEKIQSKKAIFYHIGDITAINQNTLNIDSKNAFYKTNRVYVRDNKVYYTLSDYKNKSECEFGKLKKFSNENDFSEDVDFIYVVEKH